jgi:protein-tyrosine phosphatase
MRERVTKKEDMKKLLYKHSPVRQKIEYSEEDEIVDDYSPILKGLYIGNYRAARDKNFFKKENISAVLNCTKRKDVENSMLSESVEYMRIPVDDSLKKVDLDLMYTLLPAAVEFIHKHVTVEKKNILVNCVMGRQRSVCCVIAYLMKYHDMSPKEGAEYVIDKRQEALHHGYSVNFDKTLNRYYKKLKGESVKKSEMLKSKLYKRCI